jgi:hypothetical protein
VRRRGLMLGRHPDAVGGALVRSREIRLKKFRLFGVVALAFVPFVPQTCAPAPAPKSSRCDPNYSGCVPIASDVDCIGGSGNGPAYTGRVRVIGRDIYGLDGDHDGIACE